MPALMIWLVAAVCIAVPGSAQILWRTLIALILIIFLIWAAAKLLRKKSVVRFGVQAFAVLALTIAFTVLLAARIDFIEASQTAAANESGLASGWVVELPVTVSDFPATDYARAEYKNGSSAVALLLWLDSTESAGWSPGTKISVTGTAKELDPTSSAKFAVSIKDVLLVELGNTFIADLRSGLNKIATQIPGASLVPGFAVGDTSLVSEHLDLLMKESSLTHLTAVSGSNCALVTGVIIFVASRLGAGRKTRILVAAGALLGFVAVVGPDASVQRAAIMAGVTLIALFTGKKSVAFSSLGVAIILLLMLDPWQSRAPGFTLSVAATAGILLLVPAFERALAQVVTLPRWLILPFVVSLSAQIACGPLLLLLQPGLPAAGIPANVLAAPAAPIGTGLGLLALLVIPLHEGAGSFLVWAASFASRWVEATAQVCAELPFARWFWPGGAQGAALLLLTQMLIVVAIIVWQRFRKPRQKWQQAKPQRQSLVVITVALAMSGVGIFTAVTLATPFATVAAAPKNWVMVACDVGQGDATLIRAPQHPDKVILVDTGDDQEALSRCLNLFGVKRISLLVLTHDDKDHIGALPTVIDRAEHALISKPVLGVDHSSRSVVKQLNYAGVPTEVGFAGKTGSLAEHFVWEILAPEQNAVIGSDNAASLVLSVSVAGQRFLLLGDTGADQHLLLLRKGEELAADVLKVAHHGSGDQDSRIIEQSGAQFGVLSLGLENRYGHPHKDVMAALKTNNIVALRTDLHGSIALILQDSSLVPWAEK